MNEPGFWRIDSGVSVSGCRVDEQFMMTVGQLRQKLSEFPDDMPVVMSKDGEGNYFSPLAEVDPYQHYYAENTWSGEVRHPEDIEDGDQPDHIVIVLWPTN